MADQENASAIGFVTVVEHADFGLFGGYLLLNPIGRPLEFHCTAPVKPSRTQEILFGPTLAPYLEGELISAALLARAKTAPVVICTDRPSVLAVRSRTDLPVILSLSDGASAPRGLELLPLGENLAAVFTQDRARVESACGTLLAGLDLCEPFSRIREALDEARSGAVGKSQPAAA
jgi:hypothetical protein